MWRPPATPLTQPGPAQQRQPSWSHCMPVSLLGIFSWGPLVALRPHQPAWGVLSWTLWGQADPSSPCAPGSVLTVGGPLHTHLVSFLCRGDDRAAIPGTSGA